MPSLITCDTCGRTCASMLDFDAHLAAIADRKARFGDGWQLTGRQRYSVVDVDVEIDELILDTRAEDR